VRRIAAISISVTSEGLPTEAELLTGALGAELKDFSMVEAITNDDLFGEAREPMLKHKALFARDQIISDAEHAAFARCFGDLEDHPLTDSSDVEPGIIDIWKTPDNPPERYENSWHNDATWRECPPRIGAALRSSGASGRRYHVGKHGAGL
jgi:taurine dioxygenase